MIKTNKIKSDESAFRFEFKYRISYYQYLNIKHSILPYMKLDDYTQNNKSKKYLVRSLYYETSDYEIYSQKMSGDAEIAKFRLRTYSSKMEQAQKIRAEIKVRQGESLAKYSTFTSIASYQYFIDNCMWKMDESDPVLIEFNRYLLAKALRPKVLVEYHREGYESRSNSEVRMTFDHNVRSVHEKTLFPCNPFFRTHHPFEIVLEIKCKHTYPFWLKKIILDHGLSYIANSKYTQSIEASRQDQYYLDGIVIVR